jgi:hypothetical protein
MMLFYLSNRANSFIDYKGASAGGGSRLVFDSQKEDNK